MILDELLDSTVFLGPLALNKLSADFALRATARSVTKAHRKKIEQAIARLRKNIKTKAPFTSLFVLYSQDE